MLELMIVEPVPTRAEVSDVATAVYEGADAIMLSAESATGKWPDKAVATMDRIAQSVENDAFYRGIITAQRNEPEPTSADAISAAARQVAETLNLAAIVCYTASGSTGIRVSRERPEMPVIALTPITATSRRLALVWGLHCVLTDDAHDLDDMVSRACSIAQAEGFAEAGRAHHHHRRRSAGHPRRHQHAAHRLCRQRGCGGELNGPALEAARQDLHKRVADRAIAIEFRIKNRDVDASHPATRHCHLQHGCEFVPGQSIGHAVVDSRHDRIVEHVGIEMDPEPVEV